MAAQEQFCDAVETMAVPEDVQQFWDDQSDGVKYYLSTLAPEHVSKYCGVVCCLTCCEEDSDGPEGWKELVLCYDRWRYFWIRPGQVFCDRLVSIRNQRQKKKTKLIYDNIERWPEVDHLRYPQQMVLLVPQMINFWPPFYVVINQFRFITTWNFITVLAAV